MDIAPRKHPEGLPFPPEGPGWTDVPAPLTNTGARIRLLSEHNIVAVQRNNSIAWDAAFDAIPSQARDVRTGVLRGMNEDERRRLATLAVLISKGVVDESRVHHDA